MFIEVLEAMAMCTGMEHVTCQHACAAWRAHGYILLFYHISISRSALVDFKSNTRPYGLLPGAGQSGIPSG